MKTDKIPRLSALNTHVLLFLLPSVIPCNMEYDIPGYETLSAKQSSVLCNIVKVKCSRYRPGCGPEGG